MPGSRHGPTSRALLLAAARADQIVEIARHADGAGRYAYKQGAVLAALRTDCRQHGRTLFSSALQCLLERRRKGEVGCDQLRAVKRN